MPQPPIPAPGADPSDSREVPPLQSPEDAASHPGNEGWAVAPSPPPAYVAAAQPVPIFRRPIFWASVIAAVLGAVLVALGAISLIAALFFGVKDEAVAMCHERALNKAKYPSEASIVSTTIETGDDDIIHVSGLADFPNGFGMPVRHSYFCNADTSSGDVVTERVIVLEGDWINIDE